MFGIIWSVQRHSAQARLAHAEETYRRCLRKLAKIRARLAKQKRQNAVSIILAVILLGGTPDGLHAAPCSGEAVVALLDATTAYDDIDRTQIVPGIESMAAGLKGGQRLLVRTVGAAIDDSLILFDRCVPARHSFEWTMSAILHWLTSSPASLEEERAVFYADLRDAMLPILYSHADAERTALLETLLRSVEAEEDLASVWLFSDLLETAAISTESLLKGDHSILLSSPDQLPALSGVDVHSLGAGRFHDAERRQLTTGELQALLGAWRMFVQQSGGRLKVRHVDF